MKAFKGQQVDDPKQARQADILIKEQTGAIDQAQALTRRSPDSQIAWARLAQTLVAAGKYEDAVGAARETLAHAADSPSEEALPFNPTSELVAVKVLVAAGLAEEAESFLAQRTHAADALALTYASIAENREDHTQALARLDGHEGTEISIFRGYLLLRLSHTREAITELRKAGGEGSRNPDVVSNLSYGYSVEGSHRKALTCMRQAVLLAPCSQRLGFNLVSLFVARARWSDALAELRRLREVFPNDLKIALATGFVHASSGATDKAVREYRRALSENRLQRGSPDYGQVALNLAMIESQIGKRTKAEVLAEVRKRLSEGPPSQPLAVAMADLAPRDVALKEVERLYAQLRKSESEEALLPLAVKLALLRSDFELAGVLSERWVESAPLNPESVGQLITLRGHVNGDFAEASRIGMSAIRTFPGNDFIRNGTAFSLAFDRRWSEAQSVLDGIRDSRLPIATATKGLIALCRGNLDDGLDLYDEAIKTARLRMGGGGSQFDDFKRLARLYELLAFERFGIALTPEIRERMKVELPGDWDSDPQLRLVNQLARAIGASWQEAAHRNHE